MKTQDRLLGLLSRLRDPAWQAVGVLIALVALIVSTYVAYDVYQKSSLAKSELTIYKRYSHSPLRIDDAMEDRITVLLDGEEIGSLYAYNYSISNTGRNPILPDHFIEPVQVSTQEPWEILFIETTQSSPPGVKMEWTRIATNTYQMKPLLLNSDDSVEIVIYVTHPVSTEDATEPQWSGRIVNVQQFTDEPPPAPGHPLAPITFTGAFTYLYLSLSAFFATAISATMRRNHLSVLPKSYALETALITFLSCLASNSVLRLTINRNTDLLLSSPELRIWIHDSSIDTVFNFIWLALYVLLFFSLSFPLRRQTTNSRESKKRPDTVDE